MHHACLYRFPLNFNWIYIDFKGIEALSKITMEIFNENWMKLTSIDELMWILMDILLVNEIIDLFSILTLLKLKII